jgi:hypothetical protein
MFHVTISLLEHPRDRGATGSSPEEGIYLQLLHVDQLCPRQDSNLRSRLRRAAPAVFSEHYQWLCLLGLSHSTP